MEENTHAAQVRSTWALDAFDLSPVTARMVRRGRLDAIELEHEFRRFAALILLNPARTFVPSEIVDAYWHELVLDTRLYSRFCAEVFGHFVDHVPEDAETATLRDDRYSETLATYAFHFGAAPAHLWPHVEHHGTVMTAAGHCGGGGRCGGGGNH
jgi:hypothetical protein